MTEQEIISSIQRRRWNVLVHSCIYYELGSSVVTDQVWDSWAKELMELQSKYPELAAKAGLHEYFKDWKGESGYYLPLKEDWVLAKAKWLLSVSPER